MSSDEHNEVEGHAWLVSHGQEHVALGGPTTRMRQIEEIARANGHTVSSTANAYDLLDRRNSVSVAHVFNSWSLQSAIKALSLAKRTNQPVIFSPIMLNLADRAFYDEGIKSMLARAKSVRDVEDGADLIRSMTPTWDRDTSRTPRQGVASHFEALRRQTKLADKLICLSEYERDLLQSIGVATDNVTVIPNGVDASVMSVADANLFREIYGISDFVLMVGRIEPRKNQALTAFALRELGRPVVCIGHIGDQDYFDQLKKWAGPNFMHIERISDRNLLASAYKAAASMVLVSWSEGAPLVALEAAAAGTPLVLSTMSSEKDYFNSFATYVHPADLHGIREAVNSQLSEPQSGSTRDARARFAQERFSIETHVDSTLALYKDSINGRSQRKVQIRGHASHLDVTHLAHQIHNRKPLTGVPVVEKELVGALTVLEPTLTLSAWSSRSRLSEELPITAFGTEAMGELADKPATETHSADLFCDRVELSYLSPRFSLFGLLPTKGPGPRRRILTLVKHGINRMPDAVRSHVLRWIRTHKPNFSSQIAAEHYLLERARVQHSSSQVSRNHDHKFQLAVFERPQARPMRLSLTERTRIIVLGHAWISNDRYLDDLSETVARDNLELWIHVPDILYATRPGTFSPSTTENFTRRLRTVLAIADTIITISSQSKSEIRTFANRCGYYPNIVQIMLGVPQHTGSTQGPQTRSDSADMTVLYVASMSERKRHDFLIEAWKKAREASRQVASARLILVGQPLSGYEQFRDQAFQAQLNKFGIEVIDECDSDQLASLYQNCAFTVYPSAAEGWGLPPVESLAAGKPCLLSDSLPVAKDIDSPGFERVSTLSLDAWVAAICTWIDVPAELQKATGAAEDFELPSWEKAARLILNKEQT